MRPTTQQGHPFSSGHPHSAPARSSLPQADPPPLHCTRCSDALQILVSSKADPDCILPDVLKRHHSPVWGFYLKKHHLQRHFQKKLEVRSLDMWHPVLMTGPANCHQQERRLGKASALDTEQPGGGEGVLGSRSPLPSAGHLRQPASSWPQAERSSRLDSAPHLPLPWGPDVCEKVQTCDALPPPPCSPKRHCRDGGTNHGVLCCLSCPKVLDSSL